MFPCMLSLWCQACGASWQCAQVWELPMHVIQGARAAR